MVPDESKFACFYLCLRTGGEIYVAAKTHGESEGEMDGEGLLEQPFPTIGRLNLDLELRHQQLLMMGQLFQIIEHRRR